MTRKRVSAALGVAAAMVGAAGVLTMPVASADTLSNGLTVTCAPEAGGGATCVIGGCPRVNGDYVVDAVHVIENGGEQEELGFKCINGAVARHSVLINPPPGGSTNIAVQGCRKKDLEGDWCGPWADYRYTIAAAPAAPPPKPAEQPQAPAPAPPEAPPPAPVAKPPTNAVAVNISRAGLQVKVNVSSSADIPGDCTYNADEVNGLGPSANRNFSLGPKGSAQLTFPAPLLGQTYHVVVSCRGDFQGQNVEFGHVEQDV